MGVWNILVIRLWSALGAAPQGADLASKLTILTILIAWAVRDRRRWPLGLVRPEDPRASWAIVPLVVAVLALNFDRAPLLQLAPGLLLAGLAAACWEELAFRGLLMGRLLRHGAVAAAWISSIGFGLLHAAQPDLRSAALSVFVMTGLGLSLAAVRVRTGSLWPPLAAHAIINLSANATAGAEPAAQSSLAWIPLLLGCYFLGFGSFLLHVRRPRRDGAGDG